MALQPSVKIGKKKKETPLQDNREIWLKVIAELREHLPRIVYFPTFLFDFPERIQISPGKSAIAGNDYFKAMIQDALSSLPDPLDLNTHVLSRIKKKEPTDLIGAFLSGWFRSDERERVTTALARLSAKISSDIFARWTEVLGEDASNKSLVIEPDFDEDETGNLRVYLSFKIKEGQIEYKVAERSLGFRWFFCFLLFTKYFRGTKAAGAIFLFDEPASNLHSRAQAKLLDSLQFIANGRNDIIYSTHSHHLIEPLWLEQTYVMANSAVGHRLLDYAADQGSISAERYRAFVGKNPEKSHYFQPILDCLQVAPAAIEVQRGGLLVEGKIDFYVFRWFMRQFGRGGFDVIPVGGAGNAGAMIGMCLGMTKRFILLLDGDREGARQKARYLANFPLSDDQVVLISDLIPNRGAIESVLPDELKEWVRLRFSARKFSKDLLLRAFSEIHYTNERIPIELDSLVDLKGLVDAAGAKLAD